MKRKSKRILAIVAVIVLALIILTAISGLIVDFLWLDKLDYQNVFWTIKFTEVGLFLVTLIVVFVYLGINIRYIIKDVKPVHLNLGQTPTGTPNIIHISDKQIKWILYILGLVIALFFAFGLSGQWNEWLRFIHALPFRTSDPLFGLNTSFYVFRLPFLETLQNSLTGLVFLGTVISLIYHLVTSGISLPGSRLSLKPYMSTKARRQIFVNLGLWLLLLAAGYFLDRYHLVYKHHSLIDGANYVDVHILLPVFWVMTAGCVLLAIYSFVQISRNNNRLFIFSGIGLIVIGIVGQAFLPGIFQSLKVKPNEFKLEKPYIEDNIKYSRAAYNLNKISIKDYEAKDTIRLSQVLKHRKDIQNVRIWDQNLTVQTYKQLQEIRLYYQFYNIDLDRYHTNKGYRQVLISARELAPSLPVKGRTWVNKHLQYTHGFGIVMSPTTQKTKEGSPIFYIKNIPPKSDIGLKVKKPSIYYGESKSNFKIVNTKISELDYPKGDKNVYTHYTGTGGIPIDNMLTRLLFAWHFSDINILMTNYIKKGSKIQMRRAILKRIRNIAPFLKLDNDPYIVLNNGKLYWIEDAYTLAAHYPYASPFQGQANYIRNSVKVVVDAYEGTVNFYVANPNDPVIQVYSQIFPNMFKPLDDMPATLKQHVKYPKDLFQIQLEKFSVFHMTDPRVFYNQEDLWERPQESYGGQEIQMQPYYMLGTLPASKKLQYMLISPMTPKDRDNMISWLVAKSDFPGYGQIVDYELPKERLFLGPAQIEAKINQNTKISRQISLWDQRGSKVIRGNLMVIPIEHSFLYVEPVFLFSTNVNIPQLKRVIATTGTNVVMKPTLDEAIFALYGKTQSAMPSADTLTKITKQLMKRTPVSSPKLDKVNALWKDLQEAAQNKDWETFGKKMAEINKVLNGKN